MLRIAIKLQWPQDGQLYSYVNFRQSLSILRVNYSQQWYSQVIKEKLKK